VRAWGDWRSEQMRVNKRIETSAAAWMWRALLGPAMLVDGVIATLSVGTVSVAAALGVSRRLAVARFDALKAKVVSTPS
jgi:hypothetical protein